MNPPFCRFLLCYLLIILPFKVVYAQDLSKFSENDWKNYAKAQAYSCDFNTKSINVVFNDRSKKFRDSLLSISVFTPINFNGTKFREFNCEGPVLNGIIKYYYSTGGLASEKSFEQNRANGDETFYYPNGKIESIVKFTYGHKDTARSFSSSGQVLRLGIYKSNEVIEDIYYWKNGEKASYFNSSKGKRKPKTGTEMEYNVETKSTMNVELEGDNSVFFNTKGKEIPFKKWLLLAVSEFENMEDLPFPKDNVNLTDQERIESYSAKQLRIKKRFSKESDIASLLFSYFAENEVFVNGIINHYMIVHPDFANAMFLDTLYYQNNGQTFRISESVEGRLHGRLRYFYPDGKPLAIADFRSDLLHGDCIIFYPDGRICRKERFNSGSEVDTTFEYNKIGLIESQKVWADSGKYTLTYFWEDGKSIQRVEKRVGNYYKIDRTSDSKYVKSNPIRSYYYYNREGNEISEAKFRELYPGILQETVRRTTARF